MLLAIHKQKTVLADLGAIQKFVLKRKNHCGRRAEAERALIQIILD